MNLRHGAYATDHDISTRRGRDRIRGKPTNLRTLLRWLTREYGLEAPAQLQSNGTLEEDGDPAMVGEARDWLGLQWPKAGSKREKTAATTPDNWMAVACRTDPDGYYATPLRCAIARVQPAERRNLLAELATNLLNPRSVMDANLIPAWVQNDVIERSLSILWDLYADRPLPRPSNNWTQLSDSQRAAIVDGETAA